MATTEAAISQTKAADLYGVETKRLIEQVKRNLERFPEDFMFQLDKDETAALRSQIATSNTGRGGRRYAPYVFTEQGVAMLPRTAEQDGHRREHRVERGMGEHDEQLEQIFGAIRQLIAPPSQPKRPVGFRVREDDEESTLQSTA